MHGHVDAEKVADHERIVRGALERSVAGHRRDPDELGVAGSGNDRDRIVVTGVAVEQYPRRHRPSMPSGNPLVPTSEPARSLRRVHGARITIELVRSN